MQRVFAFAIIAAGGFVASGVLLPVTWAAEPVSIRTNTAGELAEACGTNPREPAADAKLNFCYGFAQGAINVELRHAGDKKPFCFPNPAPRRPATMAEFVSWVRALPDRGSMPSVDGLFKFLAERFPCK
jgi:Rap1a immunity proteins